MRPKIRLLDEEVIGDIVSEAMDVLSGIGVYVEDPELLEMLHGRGARIDGKSRRAFIGADLVESCLGSVPGSIDVYDTAGSRCMELAGDNVHFDPGSAALWILDPVTGRERRPVTRDLVDLAVVVDGCEHFAAQSTSLIPDDVPGELSDRYRLFIALLFGRKPVVTGTFAQDAFPTMLEMLAVAAGSGEELKEKPSAIFDTCPSPPLMWSALTSNVLARCARSGVPAELVSMPLTGATAPVTLSGALVQHTAENLSGIVIHQLSAAGAPIIYGGSPSAFDMRKGTTPMGAVETMMIDMSYAQIGKHLGVPTHAYMGLSDAKTVDTQAGYETGAGVILAACAGINVVSGAGMLDFESCQSLEKILIDNQICGMAHRLVRGVERRSERMAYDVLAGAVESGKQGEYFLTAADTLSWFREELSIPDPIVDRSSYGEWREAGGKSMFERARERVADIVGRRPDPAVGADVAARLRGIMERDLSAHGRDGIPDALRELIS